MLMRWPENQTTSLRHGSCRTNFINATTPRVLGGIVPRNIGTSVTSGIHLQPSKSTRCWRRHVEAPGGTTYPTQCHPAMPSLPNITLSVSGNHRINTGDRLIIALTNRWVDVVVFCLYMPSNFLDLVAYNPLFPFFPPLSPVLPVCYAW